MGTTEERAYAKLNISLDVSKRREDGYHDMVMVMQTVSLCDELSVTTDDSGCIRAVSNLPFIPGDERNLAVRAAGKYLERTGRTGQGALIEIKKNIPVGAGMGGGSADAAAVLRAMNRLDGNILGTEELMELGAEVGSDVPFCVVGGTMLAKGRGELLSPLPDMPECWYVICKPEFSVSTPELFRRFDQMRLCIHPDTAGIVAALEEKDLRRICRRMYNVFEDVDDRRMRTVASIKSAILDTGALGAVMTGTGSAVFGVYENKSTAENAVKSLSGLCPFCCTAGNVTGDKSGHILKFHG